MPSVSVVIPNYNHAPYLRQRIESVLRQTFQDFEVILLDDCSTDGSPSIILEYASDTRVRIDLNQVNSGSTFRQWRKGIALARGKYIWVAESDDYADERLLERLVQVLDAEPDVTLAYCRSFRVNRDGQSNGFADSYLDDHSGRWAADFLVDGREECRNWFVFANSVPNASCAVFRKAVYDRVGGVDGRMRVSGDWKLWVMMALEGRIAYVSEPLNYYREHDVTVRVAMERMGRGAGEHLDMVRWVLARVKPPEAVIEKAYTWAAAMWVYPVLNRRVPLPVKWGLLRNALLNDPYAVRHLMQGALTVVRLKTRKELRILSQLFASFHTR